MSLRRVLCARIPTAAQNEPLSEAEASHILNVLRMRDGDRVEAMDGAGKAAIVRLQVRGERVLLIWDEDAGTTRTASDTASALEVLPLEIEIAVLKGDAMEWVVEKAVELGARSIAPVLTAHTVVQLDRKGPEAFQARWQKIADQALKQCGRLTRMEVLLPERLPERLRRAPVSAEHPRFIALETERARSPSLASAFASCRSEGKARDFRLLVGPEGGWSQDELALLSVSGSPVSLGPLVLRAETAAIGALGWFAQALRSGDRQED